MKRAAGAVLLLVLAAGCGGGGRLSQLDFQTKANAICTKYNAKIRAVAAATPPDFVSLRRALKKQIGYTRQAHDELAGLKPPKNYDAQYKEFLRFNGAELPVEDAYAKAAASQDQAKLMAARTRLVVLTQNADRLARGIGINGCAQHFSSG